MTYTDAQLDRIDSLLAERLMGWEWLPKLSCWSPTGPDATLAHTRSRREFRPTRDLVAAFEVAERLRVIGTVEEERITWFALTAPESPEPTIDERDRFTDKPPAPWADQPHWTAGLQSDFGPEGRRWIYERAACAPTPQLAISLAALNKEKP